MFLPFFYFALIVRVYKYAVSQIILMLLYYTVAHDTLTAVLVLDKKGVLYYAGVGHNSDQLVADAVAAYKNKPQTLLKMAEITPKMQYTINTYMAMVRDPRLIDDLNKKIPMYLGGTVLQKRVWTYLVNRTTCQSTTTYGEIAANLNIPRSSRAVGACCGSNKIALAIPCHRVVSKLGKLTGYRWGVEIKRTLLALEKLVATH